MLHRCLTCLNIIVDHYLTMDLIIVTDLLMLIDMMLMMRRKVGVLCVQETRWEGSKAQI